MNSFLKLFSYKGKLTRLAYWKIIGSIIAFILGMGLTLGITMVSAGSKTIIEDSPILITLLIIVGIILQLITSASVAKRSRDAGYSPWWAVLTWIPAAKVYWILLAIFGSFNTKEISQTTDEKEKIQEEENKELMSLHFFQNEKQKEEEINR